MKSVSSESLQNRAHAAIARADYADAEQCFRQLLEHKPKDMHLLASLGQSLCWLNRKQEGRKFLVKAARVLEAQLKNSREPRYAIELSSQLMYWGEAASAERLARLAVRLSPKSAVALNNLVLCLTRINKYAESLPIAQKVVQLLPDDPGCNIILALIEAKSGSTENALLRLQGVIELNKDPQQTARAQLEAGVLLDKLGQYDKAFEHFVESAQTRSKYANYPPQQRDHIFDVLECNQQQFDQGLLQKWSAAQIDGDGLPSPVFLLGFLRSGTTLAEQVLDAHPQILATDESGVLNETNRQLEYITGIANNQASALRSLTIEQIGFLRQFYWQRMQAEYGPQVLTKLLVDKNALNTIDIGLIAVLFPSAKILFALRDPRDVCLSCFTQAFSPAPATINLLSWSGIARQYAAVMSYWLHLRPWIQPSVLELRYEETVLQFEPCFRQVLAFLGVNWCVEVTRFQERLKGRYISTPSFSAVSQPIYTSSLARWKNYQPYYEPVLPQIQKFIDMYGYSESC